MKFLCALLLFSNYIDAAQKNKKIVKTTEMTEKGLKVTYSDGYYFTSRIGSEYSCKVKLGDKLVPLDLELDYPEQAAFKRLEKAYKYQDQPDLT